MGSVCDDYEATSDDFVASEALYYHSYDSVSKKFEQVSECEIKENTVLRLGGKCYKSADGEYLTIPFSDSIVDNPTSCIGEFNNLKPGIEPTYVKATVDGNKVCG